METSTHTDNPSTLWAFTLDRYSRPGVQEAVISLQDQYDADVNLLFFCIWYAATGRGRLTEIEFVKIEARIAHWRHEVTVPLRRLRNNIKHDPCLADLSGAMDVRKMILGAEIDSERVAQIAIESVAGPPGSPKESLLGEVAESNLRAYLQFIDADIDESSEGFVESFLSGVTGR